MAPAVLHFLPSLEAAFPLCGAADAALVTMIRTQVTCAQCAQTLALPLAGTLPPPRGPTGWPARMHEKRLLAVIRQAAADASWLTYHTFRSDHSEPGYPDLVLAKPGRPVVFAELKTARGKLTREQDRWLRTLAQAEGVRACLWRPGDLSAILAFLSGQVAQEGDTPF